VKICNIFFLQVKPILSIFHMWKVKTLRKWILIPSKLLKIRILHNSSFQNNIYCFWYFWRSFYYKPYFGKKKIWYSRAQLAHQIFLFWTSSLPRPISGKQSRRKINMDNVLLLNMELFLSSLTIGWLLKIAQLGNTVLLSFQSCQ
jgi:hypothetical protein